LIIIALLFYFIWLKEIIPAIFQNKTPKSIIESGLLINPVHVLDIAIGLPALIITGVCLLRKKNVGLLLAPAMMMFCILLSIAIMAMVFTMKGQGLETDTVLSFIFGIIALTSFGFLFQYLRKLSN